MEPHLQQHPEIQDQQHPEIQDQQRFKSRKKVGLDHYLIDLQEKAAQDAVGNQYDERNDSYKFTL